MRIRRICLVWMVTIATACGRGDRPAPNTTAEFSGDRLKAHVAFLADDLLEGREAGTRGHELAARYVATQFALLGVKPGGDQNTYFQKVPLFESAISGAPPTLVVTTPRGKRSFAHGRSVLVRGSVKPGTVKVTAPLVFVGYGMKDAAVGYDDYAGLDVKGRIAVVLMGIPKGMDSEIGAHLQSRIGRTAAEHGAVGMLVILTNATAAALPWEQLLRFGADPLTTWVASDGTPHDEEGGLNISAFVDRGPAAALFEGGASTLAEILEEADKPGGRPKGFILKSTAEIAVTTTGRTFSSPTVIGLIEGADPALKNDYVALMAHADHIGKRDRQEAGDHINNGALDNAAGVATLLEVARAFGAASPRPRRSILLIANTAEEKGLLGADYFAAHPTVPIGQITAAIDLDMPMLLYDFTDVVAYGATHSSLSGTIDGAASSMNVKLSPDPMPDQAVFVRSDHYPMVKAGVPAVMLATGMANGGEAAWDTFLSGTYHQPSDDLSQPIRWNAGAKFADLNYRIVRALADAEARPKWYAGDYFGNLYAPKAPTTTPVDPR